MHRSKKPPARPEQYLALGGGLHAIVEGLPDSAYPIKDWAALTTAAEAVGRVKLIGPGGRMFLHKKLEPTIAQLRPILGDKYFPIRDTRDFAQKAGIALVSLVVRRFVQPPFSIEDLNDEEKFLSDIRALLKKRKK